MKWREGDYWIICEIMCDGKSVKHLSYIYCFVIIPVGVDPAVAEGCAG